jgi:hypothetical protein
MDCLRDRPSILLALLDRACLFGNVGIVGREKNNNMLSGIATQNSMIVSKI